MKLKDFLYLCNKVNAFNKMAHKVRKRINKIKRKKKVRQKAVRERQKQMLAHNDYLEPFLDVIEEEYKPMDISLYRWVHNPLNSDDFKPQIYQESNPVSPEDVKVPPADASKAVILEYTDRFTLSNYTTPENAINEWVNTIKRRTKGKSEAKKQAIIEKWKKAKGQYVVKVDYTQETAIIGPQDDSIHKQAFLFEGVAGASLIDKAFQPIKIEY